MNWGITDYKEEFIRLFTENIQREGADKLLEFLKRSDFFTAPASTRFHSAHEGGLVEHTVKSYYRFVQNLQTEYDDEWEERVSPETAAVIALLHDICKVNYYKEEMRNVKENGTWVQKPYYTVDDSLPYGHGEKSVYIASGFMRLTREEAMAINWHMGGFDKRALGGSFELSEAFYRYPTALLFHLADVQASYLDERKE
jgi:hypothetical protein